KPCLTIFAPRTNHTSLVGHARRRHIKRRRTRDVQPPKRQCRTCPHARRGLCAWGDPSHQWIPCRINDRKERHNPRLFDPKGQGPTHGKELETTGRRPDRPSIHTPTGEKDSRSPRRINLHSRIRLTPKP